VLHDPSSIKDLDPLESAVICPSEIQGKPLPQTYFSAFSSLKIATQTSQTAPAHRPVREQKSKLTIAQKQELKLIIFK